MILRRCVRPAATVAAFAAIVFAGLYFAGNVLGTPANGFVGATLAKGALGQFDVFNQTTPPDSNLWLSWQKTKGSSDLYVQSNVWQPVSPITGIASTGWHSHPGHSLIIVTAGTVTNYESDDPECKPQVYTQGMSFVDSGGDHVHIVRNEGTVVAKTITVQLIPSGAARRIDAPAPANCPGIL